MIQIEWTEADALEWNKILNLPITRKVLEVLQAQNRPVAASSFEQAGLAGQRCVGGQYVIDSLSALGLYRSKKDAPKPFAHILEQPTK